MNGNDKTKTEEPTKEELATRVEQLEATVAKMMPNRRDVLKMGITGAAGAGLYASMSGSGAAGSGQSGTIGSQSNYYDIYLEDLYDKNGNVPIEFPGNGSVSIDEANIGNVVIEQSNIGSYTEHAGDQVAITANSYTTVFDLASAVDCLGGTYTGVRATKMRITWADDTTDEIKTSRAGSLDTNDDFLTVKAIPPIKNIKKLEIFCDSGNNQNFGYEVFTI